MKSVFVAILIAMVGFNLSNCTSNKTEENSNSNAGSSTSVNTSTDSGASNNPNSTQPSVPQQMPQAPVGQGGQATPPPAPVVNGVAQPILPGGLPTPPANQPPPPPTPMPGSDKDAHGCKGSAGYTWSILKQNCIRTFESCIRLNKTQNTDGAQLSAFVLFSADKSKAELFIPNSPNSVILLKNATGNFWFNEAYRLENKNGEVIVNEWIGHINPKAKIGSFKLPAFKPVYSNK